MNQNSFNALEILERNERTSCTCDKCDQVCHSQIAFTAPGDIDKIMGIFRMSREELLKTYFVPIVGVKLYINELKETFQVPVISTKLHRGGCAFYCPRKQANGQCIIHRAAPYMCRRLMLCEGDAQDSQRIMAEMLRACLFDVQHGTDWLWLMKNSKKNAVSFKGIGGNKATFKIDWQA